MRLMRPITLVFKDFSGAFKKINQSHVLLDKKRRFIINALVHAGLNIVKLIDDSSIPYNGCKSKKDARKKLKHVPQFKKI